MLLFPLSHAHILTFCYLHIFVRVSHFLFYRSGAPAYGYGAPPMTTTTTYTTGYPAPYVAAPAYGYAAPPTTYVTAPPVSVYSPGAPQKAPIIVVVTTLLTFPCFYRLWL